MIKYTAKELELALRLREAGKSWKEVAEELSLVFNKDYGKYAVENLIKATKRFSNRKEPPQKTVPHLTDAEIINYLLQKGYVLQKEPIISDRKIKVDTSCFKGDKIKLGIVSDTHLGSKYQQLTYLHTAYKYFKEKGIKIVFHAGDLVAGNGKVYTGQIYDLFCQGADSQRDYAISNYPREEGIKTYIIAGNHDLSFFKSEGLDVVQAIASARSDFVYLGHYGATIDIDGIKFYLHHPDGGMAYARSYKMQKVIEQFAPQVKPQVLVQGHYHVSFLLPMYRNVCGVSAGCFEAQTPYLTRKGIYPEIGFTVLKITKQKSGMAKIAYEWHPFFVPKEKDF